MKLNNKGFAITAVLYGLLILFVILVSSYLLVLSAKKDRVEDLVNEIENNYKNVSIVEYITTLYKRNNPTLITYKDVSGSTIANYYYATSVNLMNDGMDKMGNLITDTTDLVNGTKGNIRYYGASPNNFVYFNCIDYNNQNSTTCEKWRVIGVFNNKLKIMRNESIGTYAWDYNSDGSYDNNWSDATLQTLLNDGYYNNNDGINYYNNSTVASTVNFAFNNIGIKNNETRNLISESTWYLGSEHSGAISLNEIYKSERTGETWDGKVALIYATDYGYASDLSICNQSLSCYAEEEISVTERNCNDEFDYSTDGCYSNHCVSTNWIWNNTNQWSLSLDDNNIDAWGLISTGNVSMCDDDRVYNTFNIRPSVYLQSDVKLLGGQGTEENPFQIIF